MFERFTDGARQVVVRAQEDARRLGHDYIGCEHLLLAAAEAAEPASVVLGDRASRPSAGRGDSPHHRPRIHRSAARP